VISHTPYTTSNQYSPVAQISHLSHLAGYAARQENGLLEIICAKVLYDFFDLFREVDLFTDI
jgi:hypothetical protein